CSSFLYFFASRRRHTRFSRDWSSDVCSSDLVALGLTVGFAGAVALRGAIASQLYGVGTLDPTVLLIALGVLAMTALVASFGPARRATRVNPVIALSQE